MFGLFITKTKCMRGWPMVYSTYHQELEEPYRHAGWCLVIRVPRLRGLVVGRYTHAWPDEDTAHAAALQAHPVKPYWWELDDAAGDPDDGSFGSMVGAGAP